MNKADSAKAVSLPSKYICVLQLDIVVARSHVSYDALLQAHQLPQPIISNSIVINMAIYSSITGGFRNFKDSLRMRPIQALTWFSCWLGWSIACLEFSVLSFTLTNIASYLHVETAKISNANTVSLLSRALGGAIFGIAGDQYGRKLPLLADFTLCAVTSLGTGFIKTEGQLIAVRFLYGELRVFGSLLGLRWSG